MSGLWHSVSCRGTGCGDDAAHTIAKRATKATNAAAFITDSCAHAHCEANDRTHTHTNTSSNTQHEDACHLFVAIRFVAKRTVGGAACGSTRGAFRRLARDAHANRRVRVVVAFVEAITNGSADAHARTRAALHVAAQRANVRRRSGTRGDARGMSDGTSALFRLRRRHCAELHAHTHQVQGTHTHTLTRTQTREETHANLLNLNLCRRAGFSVCGALRRRHRHCCSGLRKHTRGGVRVALLRDKGLL